MSHPIPKDLKGEERIFSIPYLDLHFSKKATVYCLSTTVLSGLTLYISFYLFAFLFITLNIAAYILASFTVQKSKFEGGNVPFDTYLMRKIKYKKNRKIYIRKRGE